ncbi:cytochrome c oxidase assembly protein [Arthrobacter sedimenti]|uniref:cytochrome c oxidase assembly protein n=1 Tax=Arthrobacter sedimenti TaxID=2694931 RepID=UPI0014248915|nr:cytochrome c oxidase assembly protein [Arthrobacter sedimenti]
MTDHSDPGHSASAHLSGGADGFVLDTGIVLVWVGLAVLYLLAGRCAVLRGRTGWPIRRTAAWLAATGLGLAATGPLARAAGSSFTAHTAVHLVLGMLVPLLLVLGAPVTLFLRAVPASVGRRWSRLAGAAPLRVGTYPVTATLLSTIPLAFLYRDGSALGLVHHPVLGPLLHLHFLVSGVLFTYAVVGVDPNPHRAPAWMRGSAIVVGIAVHSVVAKHLYSVADQGAMPADVEQAAHLMYYGGDAIHVMLLVAFSAQVYREAGRRLHREAVRGTGASLPGSAG